MSVANTTPPRVLSATEEARDAKRQRAFHSAKDYETSASQLGDIQATEPSAKRKAALAVASFVPPDEIVDILMMLGIGPGQPDWEDAPNGMMPRQYNTMNPKGA